MIIRHIPMKSARLSSFSGLVKYIMDGQNKQERVGKISITNCNSVDPSWAVHEVLAIQAKNQRAKGDKTYHMLISFAPGENPSEEALKAIEERVVSSIGFKEHQRISAVHHDTDNLHIHVAINKIHPKTFNMLEPYRAYKTFAEVATTLEIEFGLQITNHQTRKQHSENLADDMEQHSGIESLINWMKRHCKDHIDSAKSWKEVHKILAQHGLRVRVRANGLVFCNDKGLMVKASSVSRSFSKKNLESKLGGFIPPAPNDEISTQNIYRYEPLNKKVLGSELYARFCYERQHNKTTRSEKINLLKTAKSRLIEKAKKHARIKRTAVKLMRMPRIQKKILYQQINKSLVSEIAQIRKNHSKEYQGLMDVHQNKTWADWLRQKAETGSKDALTAMRFRNRKNKSNYSISGAASDSFLAGEIDSITKEGTEIYKFDKTVIRNDGNEIKISKGGSIASLKKALEMAQLSYGNCIRVNGSILFKKIILQIVSHNNMPITFADSDMEEQRKKLTLNQERHHEQSRQHRLNARRRSTRSNEIVRAGKDQRRIFTRTKPDAFSIRQGPPAESQNGLRDLSQLDVVQLARGSKVLLQDNAHDQLECQRSQLNNHVRRSVFLLGKRNKTNRRH